MRKSLLMFVVLAGFASAAPAHKLIHSGLDEDVAKHAFSAAPTIDWNRLSDKEGKYQEIWTLDGDQLNKVTFFGGVPIGEPLFKEADKKKEPLPKVSPGMLITDIPVILEHTYRAQGRTTRMTIGDEEPAQVASRKGIRFTYTYVFGEDEIERKGEAFGTFVDGRLYLVTYEAPTLYFFDKDLDHFHQLAGTLKLNS